MSHYEALGVAKDATAAQIKAAYRRLSFAHHPDRNPGDRAAEERFKKVASAYEVLSDPKRRAAYDLGGGPRPSTFAGTASGEVDVILERVREATGVDLRNVSLTERQKGGIRMLFRLWRLRGEVQR